MNYVHALMSLAGVCEMAAADHGFRHKPDARRRVPPSRAHLTARARGNTCYHCYQSESQRRQRFTQRVGVPNVHVQEFQRYLNLHHVLGKTSLLVLTACIDCGVRMSFCGPRLHAVRSCCERGGQMYGNTRLSQN